jgi:hypothetical protein
MLANSLFRGKVLRMIATLNPQGDLVLPPELKLAAQAHPSRRYDVMVATSGAIMLLPERKPIRTLVESFKALRGLQIEQRLDPIPEPPSL